MPSLASRRSRRRRAAAAAGALAVVAALLAWWVVPGSPPEPRGTAVFSTGVRTGVYHKYGDLLERYLRRDMPDVRVELIPSEGSRQNLERVASGEAQFTFATADVVAAYQREHRPGRERLRGCARLYDDYVQLVVPRGSPVRSAADLRGLRVGVGQRGSGVRLVADRLLRAAGLDPARDVTEVLQGIDRMPQELESGGLDAFFWTGGLPTGAVTRLAERFPVRLVPLGPELVERLHAATGTDGGYYRSAAIPGDTYGAAGGGEVATVAVANLLVTTDRVDPALAEGFTRTVIDTRDRIGRVVHPAQVVDLRTAIYTDPLPLHEGAVRYYRSVKP
ncbi:TAXI family TRAP transporter solute-binding subunit [Streptomyces fuscigenes]|uniref:TAXI family TRAP transporter solute-binding subunit n=1 Tax=Streptomyces fuscigenes TaxID=1528880 RepID=UPI001F20DD5D|nr:TAXI family TRAP transporter solute-binding subunit [Streptomyces fuscigenes]MCF3961160.1 TAXI family TRAP transporter solute-binding subunit [Streptomyces fuscigenes]